MNKRAIQEETKNEILRIINKKRLFRQFYVAWVCQVLNQNVLRRYQRGLTIHREMFVKRTLRHLMAKRIQRTVRKYLRKINREKETSEGERRLFRE